MYSTIIGFLSNKKNLFIIIVSVLVFIIVSQYLYFSSVNSKLENKLSAKDLEISRLELSVTNLNSSIDNQNKAIEDLKLTHDKELDKFNSRLSEAKQVADKRLDEINKLKESLEVPSDCNESIQWLLNRTLIRRGEYGNQN